MPDRFISLFGCSVFLDARSEISLKNAKIFSCFGDYFTDLPGEINISFNCYMIIEVFLGYFCLISPLNSET